MGSCRTRIFPRLTLRKYVGPVKMRIYAIKIIVYTGFEPIRKTCKQVYMAEKPIYKIHSDEELKLETSVFESFTVANLPYRPCG